jgi:hypothetical protein
MKAERSFCCQDKIFNIDSAPVREENILGTINIRTEGEAQE